MRKGLIAVFLALLLILAFYRAPWPWQVLAQSKPPGPPPKIKVGDMAPDFTLKDQNGKDVSLKSFRGKKNVVLAFYIFAFTDG
jgi:cytochrome oxidase Cu insertion factor (SCO1/SenC/PrrC family)